MEQVSLAMLCNSRRASRQRKIVFLRNVLLVLHFAELLKKNAINVYIRFNALGEMQIAVDDTHGLPQHEFLTTLCWKLATEVRLHMNTCQLLRNPGLLKWADGRWISETKQTMWSMRRCLILATGCSNKIIIYKIIREEKSILILSLNSRLWLIRSPWNSYMVALVRW